MFVRSFVAATFALLAASSQAAGYQVVDLGANLRGNDLNNLGQVVGSATGAGSSPAGFEWTPGAGLHWFKDLPGDASFGATALNDVGQIVFVRTYTTQRVPPETYYNTYVRNPDGSRTRVPSTTYGNAGPSGRSINNAGAVTGTAYPTQGNRDDFYNDAFFWVPGQGTASLDKGDVNTGVKVNNVGQVLWYADAYNPNISNVFAVRTPYLRVAPDTDIDMNLPVVDVAGFGGIRNATGLNDAGVVAGYVSAEVGSATFPAGGDYAFLWSQAGGAQFIGGQGTEATGINNAGVVIGGSQGKPAIWTSAGGWRDLFSMLSPGDAQKLAAMTWSSLVDINDSGAILANVQIDGAPHAVLLVPTP